jgi:single-strand DNA-binding protein
MEPQQYLQGNLVQDPAQTVTANGLRLTRFRMACSGRRYDKNTGDWANTDPVFMSVVCWRQLGDNVMRSLRKGDSVVVMGRLTFREWDDPNGGGRRSRYEVDATSVGPDLSRYIAELKRPARELPDAADLQAQVPEQPAVSENAEPVAAGSVAA